MLIQTLIINVKLSLSCYRGRRWGRGVMGVGGEFIVSKYNSVSSWQLDGETDRGKGETECADSHATRIYICALCRARICKRKRSPEIDSKESTPPAYVACRAATSNGVVIPAHQAGNRFLGSLKGLQIRVLLQCYLWIHSSNLFGLVYPIRIVQFCSAPFSSVRSSLFFQVCLFRPSILRVQFCLFSSDCSDESCSVVFGFV